MRGSTVQAVQQGAMGMSETSGSDATTTGAPLPPSTSQAPGSSHAPGTSQAPGTSLTSGSAVPETIRANPTIIAGFEILNKVGQGGMGAVFRARQISMDRIVALKILPKKMAADPACKERFLREARVSAKLNHVNLINGIECGESGGYTFFAMEFVEGQTALQLLKASGRIPFEQAISILRQISEALAYAHSKQLIHRDVKPENIMVAPSGTAKLCDLGLARSMEKTEDASITLAGQAVGTPYYISPEQARGEKNLDARTDIYSLGATFYHIFSGRPMFEAPTSAAVMVKHLTDTAPSLTDVCPEIPVEYAMILSKMMAKAPTDRYSDIAQLQRDLDAAANGKLPVAAEFRAKSSCALPPRDLLKLAGTSSDNPVVTRRGTGAATGLQMRTTRGARTGTPKKNNNLLIAGAGVVVLGIVAWLALGKGKPAPQPQPPAVTAKPNDTAKPAAKPAAPAGTASPAAKPATVAAKPTTPVAASTPASTAEPKTAEKAAEKTKDDNILALISPATKTNKPLTEDGEEAPAAAKPPESAPAPAAAPQETASKPATPATPAVPARDPQIDIAYARFLQEVAKRAAKMDFSKVEKEARDLSGKDDFKPAREELTAELADLAQVVKFEQEALSVIGKSKKTVDLPNDLPMRKFGDKAKIEAFDPQRGLMVDVGGAKMPLTAAALPLKMILDAAGSKSGYAAALLCLHRGARDEAQRLADTLPEKEKTAFERKLNLIKAGDTELAARAAYTELTGLIKAKKWKEYIEKLIVFEVLHKESIVAQEKAGELGAFREFAEEVTSPLPKIFGTKSAKMLSDGFIELSYDFSSEQQLQSFTYEHGALSIQDGGFAVPQHSEEYTMVSFIAPIAELRRLEVNVRTLGRTPRMGILIVPPGSTDYDLVPKAIIRPYNRKLHLEMFEGAGSGRLAANALGNTVLDWTQNVPFIVEAKGLAWKWTVNGEELAPVTLPAKAVGAQLAFFGSTGNYWIGSMKIVFKADPAWLAAKGVKAK